MESGNLWDRPPAFVLCACACVLFRVSVSGVVLLRVLVVSYLDGVECRVWTFVVYVFQSLADPRGVDDFRALPSDTRVTGGWPGHVAEDVQPHSDTVTRPKHGTSWESIIRFVLACFLVGIYLFVPVRMCTGSSRCVQLYG